MKKEKIIEEIYFDTRDSIDESLKEDYKNEADKVFKLIIAVNGVVKNNLEYYTEKVLDYFPNYYLKNEQGEEVDRDKWGNPITVPEMDTPSNKLSAFEKILWDQYHRKQEKFVKDFLDYAVAYSKLENTDIAKYIVEAIKLKSDLYKQKITEKQVNLRAIKTDEKYDILKIAKNKNLLEFENEIMDSYSLDLIPFDLEKFNNEQFKAYLFGIDSIKEQLENFRRLNYGTPSRDRWNGESYWEQDSWFNSEYGKLSQNEREFIDTRVKNCEQIIINVEKMLEKQEEKEL